MSNSKTKFFSDSSGHLTWIQFIKHDLFVNQMRLSISKRRKNREKSLSRNVSLTSLDLTHLDHKGRALIVSAFSYGGKVFWPKANKNEVKPQTKQK